MNIKRLFPITITPNLKECKNFYVKFFSFKVVFEVDWYLQLRNETGIEIAFMKPNQPNQPEYLHEPYSGAGIIYTFEVDDVKKEFVKLEKLGANIIYSLKDEEWGQRHFMISDPANLIVDIVQEI